MYLNTGKSKVMANSTSVTMDGKLLEEVSIFKYLGATRSKDVTCTAEIRTWISTATAATAKLKRIWKSNNSFCTEFKLYKLQVVSILLYGCEAWTLLVEVGKRVQALRLRN